MREIERSREAAARQKIWKICLLAAVIAAGWFLMGQFLLGMLPGANAENTPEGATIQITENFERKLTNQIGSILEGLIPIRRVYTLSDKDMVAPKPNPVCYGTAEDPAQLEAVLQEAKLLLDGQKTLFTTDTQIKEDSLIHYYLDETILAVTWKQAVDDCVYTISEVKVAHPSQFRRFLSDGKYGASAQYTTQEMAGSVNAVVASSGDYYGYRGYGICINQGQVYRNRGELMDTCYIDENGDLLFSYAGEITDKDTAQQFADDNHVRFSVAFGPVMIRDGEECVPDVYISGEINDRYARAALGQLDTLHYVVVAANMEHPYYEAPTVKQFAQNLMKMGIPTAYALDGGQTATIVMNNEVINTVSYGFQREISDIIYFATAIPEDEWGEVTE